MKSDAPLDYAVFQLSPRRSRCQLFVSYDGATEKLASGLVKPFVTHLKVAEEQIASAAKSIKLEVERDKKSETWFTKGTLERFVRFVSTPEVLELVNTLDAEMSQLEAARKIYSQGSSDGSGGDGGATTASETTKKELLRAIDVRLLAVGQYLSTACTRASAAGFSPDTVSELLLFADQFGAHRLSEACGKFLSFFQKRSEFSNIWNSRVDDHALRSSSGSEMSVDDLANDSSAGTVLTQHQFRQPEQPDESRSASLQPANKPSPTISLRHSSSKETSIEKEDVKESNDKNKREEDTSLATTDSKSSSIQSRQPARQLSVQERINLFENKQKETSSASGSKPAVGKSVELRRLPSDVSSAGSVGVEKAVLRRWSGASDMSIDLSAERKEVDSCASTPTSVVAPIKPGIASITLEDKERKSSSDTATSLKLQSIDGGLNNQANSKKEDLESKPVRIKFGTHLAVSSGASEEASSESKLTSSFKRAESAGQKDQNYSGIQSKAFFGRSEDLGFDNQTTSLAFPGKMEQFASRGQTAYQGKATSSCSAEEWSSDRKDLDAHNSQVDVTLSRFSHDLSDGGTFHGTAELEVVGSRNQRVTKSHFRTFQRAAADLASGSASLPVSSRPAFSQSIESEYEQLTAPRKCTLEGENEVARKYDESADKQHESSLLELEDSGTRGKKFQRHGSATVHTKKSKSRRDDRGSSSSLPDVGGKTIAGNQEPFSSVSSTPLEQAQRVRQSKGSQWLNNELKMKANELEKLFAEHKLCAPNDQSSATWKSKSVVTQEKEASFMHKESSLKLSSSQVASMKMVPEPFHSGNKKRFDASPVIQLLENQDYEVTPKQNLFSLGFSDELRGKLYNKYMQKRDAKLKEEWSLKRHEKEARMKAMHDSLERSRSEMKTKLAGSADKQDLHRQTEKLRSFSAQSAVRREQPIHSFLSDEDGDQDGLTGETSLADTSSRTAQSNKAFQSSYAASSTRTAATSTSRALLKASASCGGKRKLQPENPLAQSVPNFSDFRKQNMKPSTGSSKGIGCPQVRSYSHSKSSRGNVLSFEEMPLWPHHLRKSSGNPLELNDLSLLNSDCFEPEDEFSRSMEARPLPRKGITYGISRSKASFAAETFENEDEALVNAAKGVDMECIVDEDCSGNNNGNPRGSQESVKHVNPGRENGDTLGVFCRANPASVSEMSASLPSAFRSMLTVLDSPGESPGSWHSRIHNPFSVQHEASDFDASIDSPVGSPAYWNQPDLDAARMRKKWGAAQKPNVVSDSSKSQSHREVAKGLRRFLKFGRKNRGADNLVDCVSATTSEGDDDTEDGRDPANRSSDDLRKSRMGFSQYHPSHYGFSETDSFSEQAPKSFFSREATQSLDK